MQSCYAVNNLIYVDVGIRICQIQTIYIIYTIFEKANNNRSEFLLIPSSRITVT